MAAFDPSIISQIPDFAGNPLEARQKAFKLADMATDVQLNKLRLGHEKEQLEEQKQRKTILQGGDISTLEGRMDLSKKFSQAGLAKDAMDVLKFSGEEQSRNLQAQEQRLKLLQLSGEVIGPEAKTIRQTLQTQGLPMAQAQYQQSLARIMPTLPPEARNQLPPQLPNDPQQADQLLQTAIGHSEKAMKMVAAERQEAAEKEKEKHDRATEANSARTQERLARAAEKSAGGKAPAGFEWDPDHPDTLQPIKGGPKDPNSKPWTGREKVFSERIVSSANEASYAIKNITELPVGASTGFLGVGSGPGHSMLQSGRDALRNKASSQEVQDYNTMLAGVKRNLATIETTGLAPQGSLTESFSSLELREGDTQMTKLRKLAEMRQIVEAGIDVQLADPAIPDTMKNAARKAVDRIKTAVPFTHSDITRLQANPKLTLQQLITDKGLRSGEVSSSPMTFSDPEKERRYQEWKQKQQQGTP